MDDDGNHDFTDHALLFLNALQLTEKTQLAVALLRGSKLKEISKFFSHEMFGKGKLHPKAYWDALIQQLQRNGYLQLKKMPPPFRSVRKISRMGYDWMDEAPGRKLILKVIPEMFDFMPKKKNYLTNVNAAGSSTAAGVSNGDDDKMLEHILFSIRSAMAEHCDCAPFAIATNAAIHQMVEKKPVNKFDFKCALIDGFSLARITKFASSFIDAIVKYLVRVDCKEFFMFTEIYFC